MRKILVFILLPILFQGQLSQGKSLLPRQLKKCIWALNNLSYVSTVLATRFRQTYKDTDTLEETVEKVRAIQPRTQNISNFLADFIAKRPVYVSLTTSPKRISKVVNVLRTLDMRLVKEVVIAIPPRFGRDGGEYFIPPELLAFPKIKIIRPPQDIGPALKLTATADYLQGLGQSGLIITIDDDIGYPASMISEIVSVAAMNPGAAVAGSGQPLDYWGVKKIGLFNGKVGQRFLPPHFDVQLKRVDVLEGFSGVGYPSELVDTKLIKEWSGLSRETKFSDDLVISLSFALHGVPLLRESSLHYNKGHLRPFPYGLEEDALHRGAGLERNISDTDINGEKYELAYRDILRELGCLPSPEAALSLAICP